MRAISFKLGGRFAFFKKPDVNKFVYFTYNNIHKIALLGVLGAIIGLGGYTKLFNKNRGLKRGKKGYDDGFPEFYQKLQRLKVSIIPLSPNGYFSKKIQTFNNSVGYASKEVGGNLITREQWLENPQWQIMVLEDKSLEYQKIREYLINRKAIFTPYLGKNDHFANIEEVEEIDLSNEIKDNYIASLFIKNFDKLSGWAKEDETPFLFQEITPISFQKEYHFYQNKILIFTNYEVEELPNDTYQYREKNYTFI